MIRVVLPAHLRTLAHVDGEVTLTVDGAVTQRSVLDALEAQYPMLKGTIRDHATQQRRKFVRFFALEEDLSHESPDARTAREPDRPALNRQGRTRCHGRSLTGGTSDSKASRRSVARFPTST